MQYIYKAESFDFLLREKIIIHSSLFYERQFLKSLRFKDTM